MEETREEALKRIGMSLVDKLITGSHPYLMSDKETVVFEFGNASFTLSIKDLTILLESYCDDDIDISYDAAHILNATFLMTQL